MAELPPNTCPVDDLVLPAIELLDQAGAVVNTITATACNADWLCAALVALEVYPGVTSLTWREWVPPPEVPAETPA